MGFSPLLAIIHAQNRILPPNNSYSKMASFFFRTLTLTGFKKSPFLISSDNIFGDGKKFNLFANASSTVLYAAWLSKEATLILEVSIFINFDAEVSAIS